VVVGNAEPSRWKFRILTATATAIVAGVTGLISLLLVSEAVVGIAWLAIAALSAANAVRTHRASLTTS
jgi:hypothetical protein